MKLDIAGQRTSNIVQTWLIMTTFFCIVIALGFLMARTTGQVGYLYTAVAMSFGMNFVAYFFSAKMAIAQSGAVLADPIKHRAYIEIVENLARNIGLPIPKIYVIPQQAPNAFATGRSPSHAAVAATEGLLSIMTREEIEGVMAHELAHVYNRDILLSSIVVVLVGVFSILADFFMRSSMYGNSENKGPLTMVLAVGAMLLAPIAGQLMHMAVSRKREFLADATGASFTRKPGALASALRKLGHYSEPLQTASHATAHMYISHPFGGADAGTFFAKLFMTHPPMEERIAVLEALQM
jgi:heat shock protein HtpX